MCVGPRFLFFFFVYQQKETVVVTASIHDDAELLVDEVLRYERGGSAVVGEGVHTHSLLALHRVVI